MAAEDVTQVRIEMLRRRWELTLSPHISLQLADLYRQTGRLPEAITVLEQGLEGHPASVSLRVALGRYRMENGDPQGATVALREVVDRDPSHLVANKLLVKSYLLQGEAQKARDRLDLYTLLNDSDPEIQTLERSVASGRPAVEVGRTSRPTAAEPFALPPVATTVDLAALEAPATRSSAAEPSASRRIWLASREDPFAGLAAGLGDPGDWSRLVREGIFQAPAGMQAKPVNGASGLASPPTAGPEMSATLGRLYLDQGHLAEAEAIFSALLAHQPEHGEARAGMFEIAARRTLAPKGTPAAAAAAAPEVTAAPAVPAVTTAAASPPQPLAARAAPTPSIVDRKIDILRDYLARLSRARDREASGS